MSSIPQEAPQTRRNPRMLWGYPLSLWVIGISGLLVLTSLLALFLWQLAQEPLYFEMPAEPASQSRDAAP